ncbi:MAG: hypothetical protein K0R28_6374 [Paenibacillus sp.]|jgi:hypothetical protein|nr:hypothetical protein [Paenibacillus sp.]
MNERSYFADWRAVLDRRVAEVVDCYSKVEGVRALILGGSLGGGEPWPLSDIDIIPIYEDSHQSTANETIRELRVQLIEGWEQEGWRTALDVGSLYFPAGLGFENRPSRSFILRDAAGPALGTRFDKLAAAKNDHHAAERFNHLKSLDDRSVIGRIECAPDWIRERHRLSHRSRTMVGEEITEVQDARDVLRVFARHEMRSMMLEKAGVCPDWLGVVTQTEELRRRHRQLAELSRVVHRSS